MALFFFFVIGGDPWTQIYSFILEKTSILNNSLRNRFRRGDLPIEREHGNNNAKLYVSILINLYILF